MHQQVTNHYKLQCKSTKYLLTFLTFLTFLTSRDPGWLAGWLLDWLVHWLTGWLAGWLDSWLAGWLASWLVGWRPSDQAIVRPSVRATNFLHCLLGLWSYAHSYSRKSLMGTTQSDTSGPHSFHVEVTASLWVQFSCSVWQRRCVA